MSVQSFGDYGNFEALRNKVTTFVGTFLLRSRASTAKFISRFEPPGSNLSLHFMGINYTWPMAPQ